MGKTSLRIKLLLSVGVIIFIVLGTSSFLHIQDLQRDYLEALEWRAEALAQSIVNAIRERYRLNPATREMLGVTSLQCARLYELNQEKSVTHVAVIKESGEIAAHNDKTLWNTPVESPVLLDHLNRRKLTTVLESTTYHTLVPIFAEDDVYLGTVDIGFSKHLVDEKVRQLLWQAGGLFVMFLVIAFTATSVLVQLLVTKPIRDLSIVGKKIAKGELVQMRQSEAGKTISRSGQGASSDEIGTLTRVFQDMMSYLQDMASAATRIATGDLSQKITPLSEDDVLGTAFQNMSAYLNTMASAATTIAEGDLRQEIQLGSERDTLAGAFQKMMSYLHDMALAASRIATGDLSQEVIPRSKHDLLGNAFQQMATYLNQMASVATTIAVGDLHHKIQPTNDRDTLAIAFRDMMTYLQDMAYVATCIANGELSQEVTLRSEHDVLGQAFQEMTANLKDILREIEGLIQSVQEGELSRRSETTSFAGDWHDLVAGINSVIEAFVAPINTAAVAIDQIAKGNIPSTITEEYRGDFNTIKENLNILIDATNDITQLAEAMAAGDLTITITERSNQDILMRALKTMLTKLNEVVIQVKLAADNVAAGSQEMRSSAEEMSEGSAQQASAAEEVSSSMEEMAANIRQNADNARQTEKIALQSAQYAEEGGKVVAETLVAMRQIVQKITIIKEIADQTRMLSLNATIEAARAQEHGKAFSVVAAEVRQLSDVTKRAAEEIDQLATSSLEVSQRAGETLTTLVPSIHKTAELVQEISAASSEQSTGAEHINSALQQLDQVIQQNAMVSENVATAAEELAAQAEQLQRTMMFFRIDETPIPPSKGLNEIEQETKLLRSGYPSGTMVDTQTRNEVEDVESNEENRSAEYAISLDREETNKDELDNEFERY